MKTKTKKQNPLNTRQAWEYIRTQFSLYAQGKPHEEAVTKYGICASLNVLCFRFRLITRKTWNEMDNQVDLQLRKRFLLCQYLYPTEREFALNRAQFITKHFLKRRPRKSPKSD